MEIMQQRDRAVSKVLGAIRKKWATLDDVLSYSPAGDGSFYTKRDGNWKSISTTEAYNIVNTHLESWADDGTYGEDILNVNVGRCPKCGIVEVLDALSRKDSKTHICSGCGTLEAFDDLFPGM